LIGLVMGHCDYHLDQHKRQVPYSFHGAQRFLDSV
jgi:hypothetical protein